MTPFYTGCNQFIQLPKAATSESTEGLLLLFCITSFLESALYFEGGAFKVFAFSPWSELDSFTRLTNRTRTIGILETNAPLPHPSDSEAFEPVVPLM